MLSYECLDILRGRFGRPPVRLAHSRWQRFSSHCVTCGYWPATQESTGLFT
jgi:hypothetical protein